MSPSNTLTFLIITPASTSFLQGRVRFCWLNFVHMRVNVLSNIGGNFIRAYFRKLKEFYFAGSMPSNGCEPGWYKANNSCHLFYFQYSRQWGDARTICHLYGAELAVFNDARTVQDLANRRKELNLDDRDLYLGLSGQLKWIWSDGSVLSNNTPNQWGPNEPSNDGKCGAFLNAIRWDSNWKGYGWRWNDIPCTSRKGYICQQPLGMPARYCNCYI